MKTLLLILMLALVSCQKDPAAKPAAANPAVKTASDSVFVNEADSLLYKLYIIDDYDNNKYMLDDHGKCTVLLTNTIEVDNKYYCGFNFVNKAVQYAQKINSSNVTQKFAVHIKNSKGKFEEVLYLYNRVSISFSNDPQHPVHYGIYELGASLEDGSLEHSGKYRECLKVTFKEKDYEDGYRMATFNFIQDKTQWQLASTESFNNESHPDYAVKEVYKKDTLNNCTQNEDSRIYIDIDCLLGTMRDSHRQ